MNSPFPARIPTNSPSFTMSSMALVLGLMIGLAWVTNRDRNERISGMTPDQRERISLGLIDFETDLKKLQNQVEELRTKNTNYEKALSTKSGDAKLLNQSLQDLKVAAGLSELIGPGIVITLTDSKRQDLMGNDGIVHDYDVLRVVNELWNAGAEAIAVKGQRVVTGTSIRCVGSVIRVNDVPLAPPYEITAIGESKTLLGAFELPEGIAQEIKSTDPNMFKIEALEKVKLPSFNGASTKNLAREPASVPGEGSPGR